MAAGMVLECLEIEVRTEKKESWELERQIVV